MRKLLIGFCMSWGFFCYIPGPKKWDEEARPYMLAWLPTVSAIMGIIWALLSLLISKLQLPYFAAGALITWLPFIISGFIHVDGYMDVNDALMSRASLEKKRAILKDSRCGTFAIVAMIFLVMMEFGFMTSAYAEGLIYPAALVMIMAVPRGLSALMMMSLEPMETSQYIEMQKDNRARGFLILQLVIWAALAFAFSGGDRMRVLITVLACGIGTLASIFIARKELQGMNGDVAGYGILWGELLGMMSLIITL